MTTTELANLIGCHMTTASRYLNGHRLPGVAKLEQIRVALGMTHEEAQALWAQGPKTFGAFLRKRSV